MTTLSLNQWFSKNTKIPLLTLGVVVALILSGIMWYTHNKSKQSQTNSIEGLISTVSSLGLQQNNRTLLQSSIQFAIAEFGVRYVVVCHEGERIFNQPMDFGSCPTPPKESLLQSIVQITPAGFEAYKFYFYVDRLHVSPSIIVLNLIIIIFLGFVFKIIYQVQRKFSEDILFPLENSFSHGKNVEIKEIVNIKKKFDEHIKSKENQAIAATIVEHNLNLNHNIKSIKQTFDVMMSGEFSSEHQKRRFRQVSDDIKSLMAKVSEKIPERKKIDAILSEETFFDYVNEENKKKTKVNAVDAFEIAVEHKRVETKKWKHELSIDLSYSDNLKGVFIDVVGPELRGILSNFMNNSAEAEAKRIQIELSDSEKSLTCRIKDDGKGVSEDVKNNVFKRGFTFGKENGTGYGLYHAKRFIESWGGELTLIDSQEGETCFEIRIPKWQFQSPSHLSFIDTIVVVDDEDSIHEKWSQKKDRINADAKILSFKKTTDFYNWFNKESNFSRYVFFFDSDLGEDESGEEIINNLGINHVSYLLTNNYNNPKLQIWCNERSIEIIPKEYLLG